MIIHLYTVYNSHWVSSTKPENKNSNLVSYIPEALNWLLSTVKTLFFCKEMVYTHNLKTITSSLSNLSFYRFIKSEKNIYEIYNIKIV